jgi:hypothetical protein
LNDIADGIFGTYSEASTKPNGITLSEESLRKFVGTWRDEKTRMPVRLVLENGILTLNGARLTPVGANAFTYNDGSSRVEFTRDKSGRLTVAREIGEDGVVYPFFLEPPWYPTRAELAGLVGSWYSEEAEATFNVRLEGNSLFLVQRPATRISLTPINKGHFSAQDYVVWATHDSRGKIDKLHIGASRMRDMLFERARK